MRGVSTLAEAWFQAIAITPGSSRKSRRFIHSTRRHGFHRGRDLNLAHAEVLQVQHGQVPLFRDAARTAASRGRGAKPLVSFRCVPALPLDLNVTKTSGV